MYYSESYAAWQVLKAGVTSRRIAVDKGDGEEEEKKKKGKNNGKKFTHYLISKGKEGVTEELRSRRGAVN